VITVIINHITGLVETIFV